MSRRPATAPDAGSLWRWCACALAVLAAGLTGLFLLRIPVQLSDSFTEFTTVYKATLWDVVRAEFHGGPYMRPLRRGLIKLVYDLSQGQFQPWFRGFQVAQLLALLCLTVGALRVRTAAALAVVPLALAMVLGSHTFAGAILEGLPINHFLTILVCCALTVNLLRAEPSLLNDALAVVVMVVAMLTIESGLLVAVLVVLGRIVGMRGVSRPAVAAVVACAVAYMVGRFVFLSGTTPGLDERSAGFGFHVLSTGELMARFGANPLPFYLYNMLSAVSCVLFAEPRGGVWSFVQGVLGGHVEPWRLVNVASSTATTGLIAWFAWTRFHTWRRQGLTAAGQLVVVWAGLVLANAVFAFAYEKDAILGPAGFLQALAAAAVLIDISEGNGGFGAAWRVPVALLAVASVGWTIRLVGVHYSLQVRNLSVRTEWAYYDDWERKQQFATPWTPEQQAIRLSLMRQAIRGASSARQLAGPFPNPLFDVTQ